MRANRSCCRLDICLLLGCGQGSSAVKLLGYREFYPVLAVTVVQPIQKSRHPLAGLSVADEWPIGVIGSVLDGSKQGF